MEPNPQLKQISKKFQMSDRLLKKARAVEKALDDLLCDNDPETEIQMMDVEDPIQASLQTQPELDSANLLMLADVALTHADLKPYKMWRCRILVRDRALLNNLDIWKGPFLSYQFIFEILYIHFEIDFAVVYYSHWN